MGLEYQKPEGFEDDDDIEMFVLFPNMGEGCGHGTTDRGFMTAQGPLLPKGYDRTINMMDLGDQIMPSFAWNYYARAPSDASSAAPSWLTAWQTTAYIPYAIYTQAIAAASPKRFQDGAVTAETQALSASRTFGSGCFHDDGAGVAYWYSGSFVTTTGAAALLNRRTQAGVWTQDADVNAKFVASIGGAMWRSTSDYQVSKCPAGSEPFTLASWGGSFQVGTNDSKITAITGVGESVVVLKEDGIYFFKESFNDGAGGFVPEYRTAQRHPFNFNFVADDNAGGFYTATANGDIINVQKFGGIVVSHAVEQNNPGRDTPIGRIEDMAVDGADIYAITAPVTKLTKNVGLKILKTTDNFGSFTDLTANLVDDSFTTAESFTIDTLLNGDAILIGADTQFFAVQLLRDNVANTATTLALSYSTGVGTWSTDLIGGGAYDGTYNNNNGTVGSFGQSGIITLLPYFLPVVTAGWVTATYNSQTKYWWRLTFTAAVGATANVTDVSILPARSAPPFVVTGDPVDMPQSEAAGLLSKILKGRRDGDRIIWDDIYTLPATQTTPRSQFRPPGGNKIAVTSLPTTNSPDASLFIACRDWIGQVALPNVNNPALVHSPVLQREVANMATPTFYPSALMTNGEREFVALQVYGKNISEQVDTLRAAVRPDDTHGWYVFDDIKESFAEFTAAGDMMRGKRWSVAVQLVDGASTDAGGPGIEAMVLWLRKVKGRRALQPARATPEVS